MPRKRQVKKERTVPQVPIGDEGNGLTKEQQQQKLQTFLLDFDRQFESKVQDIKRKVDATMNYIDTFCQLSIQRIPKPLRKMTLGDFIAVGGTFKSALGSLAATNDTNPIPMQVLKENKQNNSPLDNIYFENQAFDKISSDFASVLEEQGCTTTAKKRPLAQENQLNSTMKKRLVHFNGNSDGSVAQTRTTRQNSFVNKSLKAPLSTAKKGTRMRAGMRALETPRGNQLYNRDFRTPAITPKFDPRLPMSSFDRSPKQGERLMSIDGSPVAVVQTRRLKTIKKAQDRISTALTQTGLDNGTLDILNDVLAILKE